MPKKKVKKLVLTMALINLLQGSCLADDVSYIFNKNNVATKQYGGNQLDFECKYSSLIKDSLIYEEMQKYFPKEKFNSCEEADFFYRKYFQLINNNGCGYVVIANSIFNYFKGKEKLFYETFGFPMYNIKDDKVDYNYELMILKIIHYDFFELSNEKDPINCIKKYFAKDFCNEQLRLFTISSDYIQKLPNNYSNFSEEEKDEYRKKMRIRDEKFKELYVNWLNTKNDDTVFGLYLEKFVKVITGFLKKYNIEVCVFSRNSYMRNFERDDIIACEFYSLYKYDENGEKVFVLKNGSLHYMYISDVTENGEIIVSTWGNKYYLDVSEVSINCKIKTKYY